MRSILFLVIIFIANSLSAGTIDPSTHQNSYIEYGKKFPYIVKLVGKNSSGKKYFASAVVIKPNWFLTAAHAVTDSESCFIMLDSSTNQLCAKKIYCHKDFTSDSFGYHDIALGYIEEDIGLESYPKLYSNKDEIGKQCSISGYGLTGTFLTGAILSDSNRRAGTNTIEYIDRNLLVCTASKRNENITKLEFIIAGGDSGGGLFIDNKLAGINSCVMATDSKTDSNYGDEGAHTRISLYIEWIESIINSK